MYRVYYVCLGKNGILHKRSADGQLRGCPPGVKSRLQAGQCPRRIKDNLNSDQVQKSEKLHYR